MNEGAPHQNGKVIKLTQDDHGPCAWYLNNSIVVNRACTKWLQERGLNTDKYNLSFGTLYRNKITPQSNE